MKKAAKAMAWVLVFVACSIFVAWRTSGSEYRNEYKDVQEQIQMERMITG